MSIHARSQPAKLTESNTPRWAVSPNTNSRWSTPADLAPRPSTCRFSIRTVEVRLRRDTERRRPNQITPGRYIGVLLSGRVIARTVSLHTQLSNRFGVEPGVDREGGCASHTHTTDGLPAASHLTLLGRSISSCREAPVVAEPGGQRCGARSRPSGALGDSLCSRAYRSLLDWQIPQRGDSTGA